MTFGSLLGVFLLSLLTRRRIADQASVYAMIAMAALNVVALTLSETHGVPVAWSWLVIFGTGGTTLLGTLWTLVSGAGSAAGQPDQ